MLISGIAGCRGKTQIAELINALMLARGRKVCITDSNAIFRLDKKMIEDYLTELIKSNVEILVVRIESSKSGEKLLHLLDFDVIIFTGITDDINENAIGEYRAFMQKAFKVLNKKSILIVNVDGNEGTGYLETGCKNMIGYGFKSDSVITTSSIGDTTFEGDFIYCIQKMMKDINGRVIEPQERKVELSEGKAKAKAHNILAAVAFDVVSGIDSFLN